MPKRAVLEKAEGEAPKSEGVPIRGRGGRSSRQKSEVTRNRLRGATARLLERTSLRDLKVSDIAHLAGVAPATFYVYFADVNEAVLAVLEEVRERTPPLAEMVAQMAPEDLPSQVRTLIKAYLAFWQEHYAVLRTRNLRADEGDVRFREARAHMLRPVLFAFSEKLAELRGAELDRLKVRPLALATVLLGTLERLAGVVHLRPPHADTSRGRLVDAAVLMLVEQLRPRPAEAGPAVASG